MENSNKTNQKAVIEQLLQQKHELLARIEHECIENESFREKLLKDPTLVIRTISRELGSELPEKIRIVVHEEDDSTMHIVVPPKANRELSMEELEDVSGGFLFSTLATLATCLSPGSIATYAAMGAGKGIISGALNAATGVDVKDAVSKGFKKGVLVINEIIN